MIGISGLIRFLVLMTMFFHHLDLDVGDNHQLGVGFASLGNIVTLLTIAFYFFERWFLFWIHQD